MEQKTGSQVKTKLAVLLCLTVCGTGCGGRAQQTQGAQEQPHTESAPIETKEPDVTPPEIVGAKALSVEKSSSISYKKYY